MTAALLGRAASMTPSLTGWPPPADEAGVRACGRAGVPVFRRVELEALLELREQVLLPGHPGRPVTWWYDNESAQHYGSFLDDQLIGSVSITPQELPTRLLTLVAVRPHHVHSMAVESDWQGRGRTLEVAA